MSQTASPSGKSGKRGASPLTPPDERFWQRYSPHAEFPLSSAGSLLLHLLIFGVAGLMAWLGVALFSNSSVKLPVEAVRVAGGGGDRNGQADGTGISQPRESGDTRKEAQADVAPPPEEASPTLNVDPEPQIKPPQFESNSGRKIQDITAASKSFKRLQEGASRIQSPGSSPASKGQGGSGKGGGKGSGTGTGVGSGSGEGPPANLSQRQKKQRRWVMGFDTRGSEDYVAQLQGLDAILAIPVAESGGDFDYKFFRNLTPGSGRSRTEDAQKVLKEVEGLIRWIDDNPRNVEGVLAVLGLPVPKIPREKYHFIAIVPEKLELKLTRLERAYLKKYPNRNEDDIEETKFRIKNHGRKYEPEVEKMTFFK